MTLRLLTAGESHGERLTVILDGVPAGLTVREEDLAHDLQRRQGGHGRGGRMAIEHDEAHIVAGVRGGLTLGSPITLEIANRDWETWRQAMVAAIDAARERGDTLGGVFTVIAEGVPPGLGSYRQWDTRLDGLLAQAIVSIPACKAVAIGDGVEGAGLPGSQVHDVPVYDNGRLGHDSNRAGGLTGGVSNGEPLVVHGYMKPISTLLKPLATVDLKTKEPARAHYERSDICVVPAAGVVGEAMVALVLAGVLLEKFGSDSMAELHRNVESYLQETRR